MSIDPKRQTAARIKRTEKYADKLRRMFSETVNEILDLHPSLPAEGTGEMFSFDSDPEMEKEVEQLLRRLQAAAVMAVQKGVEAEWEEANKACDALLKDRYAKKILESADMTGWNARNGAAMRLFIKRSDGGMNLSDRIWQSCRQLRDEMEVALSVSIGEGMDAGTISRRVRQYLNDPELMFRRFRYIEKEPVLDKDGKPVMRRNGKPKMQNKTDAEGNPVWRTKWKKRIADPSRPGRYKFIDYDKNTYRDKWTGRGYYKSAAQNAMRVARTETNIAYRRADHERWQGLDFVMGQRVQLSKNHPCEDICDALAGDYPKDFTFDGWHPQCFCFVTPILMKESEVTEMLKARREGRAFTPKTPVVTDCPQEFKAWVKENADKIDSARRRGKEPYFIRNNAETVDAILKPGGQKHEVQQQQKTTIVEKTNTFKPAATIEEAQAFAKQFVEKHMRSDKVFAGSVDYKNIDLDIANEINRTLQRVFDDTSVPPIAGIKTISPISAQGKKAFKDGANAIASYDPVFRGIYINRDILGSVDKFNAYIAKSNDAFEYVISNISTLTGRQREIAERYQLAGRSLVDDSVGGCINHELGHHIQWTMPTEVQKAVKAQMQRYAPALSGYAGSTWGEYIAESFAAYMKGETSNIDPELMRYFDEMIKSKGASLKKRRK